ncbi:MAG TPA: HAD family hydrolase [Micromonospora sp.]|nr:HAD family hydrolase [Micromonospora sp.]
MGPQPRLIATDLDGTLLRGDNSVSPRTAAVLARLSAEGRQVVLATGRPIRWMQQVYDQLQEPVPAICANGAVIYDPVRDEVLRADPLSPDLLAQVARRLRAAVPGVSFAVEVVDGREMRHEIGYPVHRWDEQVRMVDAPEELLSAPAVKLLARVDSQDPDVFVKVVSGALQGLAEATHSSYSGLVEISAAGVTKAAGLAWFCARHGLTPEEAVVFGDMPNDLPMLTWAGHAVAMANGHPAVRQVADAVTHSNEEDGVAAYLEKLFPASPATD